MEVIASIKFLPVIGTNKMRVEFEMPLQVAKKDGLVYLKLPLLGDLETVARNEEEIDTVLAELSDCFIQAAQKFGKGVHEELRMLGWSGTKNSVRFKLNDRDRRPEFNHIHGKNTTSRKFAATY